MKELKEFQKLSTNIEANRTDINVMTQHISNRAGDFAKRRANLKKNRVHLTYKL